MNEYERMREERIKRNEAMLATLQVLKRADLGSCRTAHSYFHYLLKISELIPM